MFFIVSENYKWSRKKNLILVNKLYKDDVTDQNLTFPKISLFIQTEECYLIRLFSLVY